MEEKDFNELNEETRTRGVKRTSEIKIAEVSTSKKKRAKKAPAEAPEPAQVQINFDDQETQSEECAKRSRLYRASKDVADGEISVEELAKAIHDALTERNIRLGAQGAFYNPPEQPAGINLDMEAFNRSARAISIRRERTAALMRNARPLPSSNINPGILNSSVEGSDPSSPIAEPQLLASTPHLSAMTPGCATEPPASVLTTGGAHPMLQSYASLFSVAQSTHGQHSPACVPLVFLPSHSTGRPIQRHFQSHHQPHSSNYHNLVSYRRPMGSIQLLMTAVQPPRANFAAPLQTLPHRFLPSHSTGRPVDYPLWEVTAPSNLMRWPPRSQYRCADNLKLSIWHKQITAS
jgi:hypothetical protein